MSLVEIIDIAKRAAKVQSQVEDLELLTSYSNILSVHIATLSADELDGLLTDIESIYHCDQMPSARKLMIAEYQRNEWSIPYKRIWRQGQCFMDEPEYDKMKCPELPKFRMFFHIINAAKAALLNKSSKLRTKGSDSERETLFAALIKDGFISTTTDSDSFLWGLGSTLTTPVNFTPIVWLKNKQLLRELLEPIVDISKADMARAVPLIFSNRAKTALYLAKNKPIPSKDSDKIKNMIATIYKANNQQ